MTLMRGQAIINVNACENVLNGQATNDTQCRYKYFAIWNRLTKTSIMNWWS